MSSTRRSIIVGLALSTMALAAENRWEPNIRKFEEQDARNPPPKHAVLFVGSSTIGGWNTKRCFPNLVHLKRGFGGSRVEDSLYFADRIILPYEPATVVFYAGDNDLGAGESPARVRDEFLALYDKVHQALPQTKVVFLSVKLCGKRWALRDRVREANRLIREAVTEQRPFTFVDLEPLVLGADGQPRADLFREDQLHFNDEGYRLLSDLVRPLITPAGKP